MAVCDGTLNYTAGGIGKGKGFHHSLVAVGGSGGQRPNVPWTKNMKCGAHVTLFAASSSLIQKRHQSTAGLTETFQIAC